MVVRISKSNFSNTKKFFKKNIKNFKSFLSCFRGGYRKLPKNSPLWNPLPCGRGGGHIKSDLESTNEGTKYLNQKAMIKPSTMEKHEKEVLGQSIKYEEENKCGYGKQSVFGGKRGQKDQIYGHRSYLVAEKMKELAMIDKTNAEHCMDIEEVLHYYSCLTCPAYREILDKFFVDVYSELFRSSIERSLK